MTLHFHSHPYSGYGQKVAVALYELGLSFDLKLIDGTDEASIAAFRAVSPFGKMPVLVDTAADRTVVESSIIIEYLERLAGEGRLIPANTDAALETRLIDRVIDTYAGGPMNRIATLRFGPEDQRDPHAELRDLATIAQCWDWLEDRLSDGRVWGAGETFTMADCAAAPILTYVRRLVPFGERPRLRAWHKRLMARPSFVRALEDAAPFGDMMPAPPAED